MESNFKKTKHYTMNHHTDDNLASSITQELEQKKFKKKLILQKSHVKWFSYCFWIFKKKKFRPDHIKLPKGSVVKKLERKIKPQTLQVSTQ